jgi:DNA-binding Lrp family transcriptional regulator
MELAVVLINVETGADEEVRSALSEIANVREFYLVYGVYDIVAIVEAESMTELKEVVITNIRKLDKVKSTLTMIAYG